MPERHDARRRHEAVQFAKKQSGNVKLFLEGVRRKETGAASTQLGHPIVPIEHDLLPLMMSPLIAANAALRLNLFIWAVSKRRKLDLARKIIKDEKEVAALVTGRPEARIRLDDVKLLLGRDAAFSANVTLYLKPFEGIFGESLNEILAEGSEGIPPKLRAAMELLARTLLRAKLREMESSILSEVNGLFDSHYGFTLRMTTDAEMAFHKRMPFEQQPLPYDTLAGIPFMIRSSNLVGLHFTINAVLDRLKELRDMYMAYAVAREDFEVGVLNVGLAHVLEGSRMMEIIKKCDIESTTQDYSFRSFFEQQDRAAGKGKPPVKQTF